MCVCTEDVQNNNIFKEWLTYFACHTRLLINLMILLGTTIRGARLVMRPPDVQSNILLRNGPFACQQLHTFVCL